MKQQPDKLFQSKLKDYEKVPPTDLWKKIESGLENRKRGFPYLSVAASVIFLLISGYIVTEQFEQSTSAQKNIASSSPETSVPKVRQSTDSLDNVLPSADPIKPVPAQTKSPKAPITDKKKPLNVDPHPRVSNQGDQSLAVVTEQVTYDTTVMEDHQYDHAAQLAYKAPSKSSESITMVFTAEQTKEYLVGKDNVKATSAEKKSSTLKKLLKKAADLSTNQDPFGELRQKKNEILALNFKTDKQRGQKK